MAENENKTGRLSELLILILVVVCALLIATDVAQSVSDELDARRGEAAIIQETLDLTPTPRP